VEGATLAKTGLPRCLHHLSTVPCPLPRRTRWVRASIASPSVRPSPYRWRVGIRIFTFEACSGFTHITARWIARPPKATFVTRLQCDQLPSHPARQLPDLSTTIWVDSSSTGDTRPSGHTAISGAPFPRISLRSCGLRIRSRLFGFLQPVLPGRGPGSKTTLGAGAQPIAELRRNVAEWTLHAELERGVHRPIGIVEDFPPHRDQIGLPVTQDLLGLVAMDDEADRHRHDVGMALHVFRQRHLVAKFDFLAQDRRHLGDAAGRAVDDVDAPRFEDFCQPRALLRPP